MSQPVYRSGALPVHLTAEATIAYGAQGQGPNTTALKNPDDLPMIIHEVKFGMRCDEAQIIGAALSASLSLGEVPLTAGFVPLWNFARRNDGIPQTEDYQTITFVEMSWKLPRPLYVPAGAIIKPLFSHNGLTKEAIVARVSYSGQSIPRGAPLPEIVSVPYVMAYQAKPFAIAQADSDESTELDIANPFGVPLHIQRMIGWQSFYNGEDGEYFDQSDGDGYPYVGGRSVELRVADSRGVPIIRDFAQWQNIFSNYTYAWELEGAVMEPRDFYKLFFKKTAPPHADDMSVTDVYTQSYVSVIGWRDMPRT